MRTKSFSRALAACTGQVATTATETTSAAAHAVGHVKFRAQLKKDGFSRFRLEATIVDVISVSGGLEGS